MAKRVLSNVNEPRVFGYFFRGLGWRPKRRVAGDSNSRVGRFNLIIRRQMLYIRDGWPVNIYQLWARYVYDLKRAYCCFT